MRSMLSEQQNKMCFLNRSSFKKNFHHWY